MQKLNLHVKLVYCIPLYKLRTIQIFSIKIYKYFLISIKTGRRCYIYSEMYEHFSMDNGSSLSGHVTSPVLNPL